MIEPRKVDDSESLRTRPRGEVSCSVYTISLFLRPCPEPVAATSLFFCSASGTFHLESSEPWVRSMKRRLNSSESFTWLVNLFVDLMEVEDFFLALRIENAQPIAGSVSK